MRAPQTRTIGGRDFQVVPLPGREASDLLVRLLRIVAPGAGSAAAKVASGDLDESALSGGLSGVVDRFTVEEKRVFESAFAKHTFVDHGDGKRPQLSEIIDLEFQGDLGAWLEWMAFALEVNFAGFFRVLVAKVGSAMGSVRAKMPSSSSSPTRSTGASGAS